MTTAPRWTRRLLGIAAVAGLCACSYGPKVLKGDRYAYNLSIHRSNTEEVLVNLVRAKYFEPLFFMQVGSVAASFTVGGTAGLTGTWTDAKGGGGSTGAGASLGAAYQENPVVTFSPLQGEAFAKQMLAEITLDRLLLLNRANFSLQTLCWMTVQQIGALHNFDASVYNDPAVRRSYRDFLDLTAGLQALWARGDLVFVRMGKDAAGGEFLLAQARYADAAEAERLEGLLGIRSGRAPDAAGRLLGEIHFTPLSAIGGSAGGTDPLAVPVKLKSFYFLLYDMTAGIQVPERDRSRTVEHFYGVDPGTLPERPGPHEGLIRVRSAAERPMDAYAAVPYRGAWFWVDDADVRSKAYLTILEILFSLQSGDVPAPVPVLTLPVGQ